MSGLFYLKEGLSVADGASVPALGLSNKAVFVSSDVPSQNTENNRQADKQYTENYFIPQHLSGDYS